jgi:sugar (pentulose or hexulose) kinase
MSDLLLGIDVGTSACKAAVVDAGGAERAHGQAPTPWQRVPTGAEADPWALLDAALEAARAALAAAPEGRVRGIGVTGMAETGVLLDARGAPLAPAIAWHDARGGDEARALGEDLGGERFVRTTGLPVSALCTAPKLRWLVEHRPEVRAARRWRNVGEWVVRGLGGDDVAELSLSSRTGLLDLAAKAPFADALAWTGLRDDLLPETVLAGTAAGRAGDALPGAAGAVLTVAGHDHLAAGVGVGVVASGDVLDSCGTAEALVRVVAPPLDGDAIERVVSGGGDSVGWHVAEGRQAILGGIWSGIVYKEVLEALDVGDDGRRELDAGAFATAPGDAPALELDFRSLERPPVRLPAGVAPERLWRAALDAAAGEVDARLARIDAVAGPRRKLVVTGGWARDEAVIAAKARLGAFETPPVVEAGCRGAALLAGVAAGLFESADALPPIPVPAGRSH